MTADRFKCSLTMADEPECTRYARVTLTDATGETARACAQHAVDALFGTVSLTVDWDGSKGLNEHEVTALRIAEERSRL